MNDYDAFRSKVWHLAAKEGFRDDFTLSRLEGGKNNRVFKIESVGKEALLKAYFQHPSDLRDRCSTEFSFLSFAWSQGIRSIPRPLQFDANSALALYEFIQGEKPNEKDVTDASVQELIDFFVTLNSRKSLTEALSLRTASEACFSIASHLECTQRRVSLLVAAADDLNMDRQAKEFILNRLLPSWTKTRKGVESECRNLHLSEKEEISMAKRILSPSDIGFHNAIKRESGKLCFVDFEYAGWDDVAKTVCDFYLQPVIPLPARFFQAFAGGVLEGFKDKELEMNRIRVLMPVHQIKWVCIMLNDFLPVGEDRRKFSLGEDELCLRREKQLEKANGALQRVEINKEETVFCI